MDSQDFVEIIDEIGRRLEGPAKHVFDLAVRQVYVEFFVAAFWFIPITVALFFISRYYYRLYKNGQEFTDGPFLVFMSTPFLAIGWIITFIMVVSALADVLNPEWRAIQMIANAIVP